MEMSEKASVLVIYVSKTTGYCPKSLLQIDSSMENFLRNFQNFRKAMLLKTCWLSILTVAEAHHNPTKHLRWSFSGKHFREKLYLRCLKGF